MCSTSTASCWLPPLLMLSCGTDWNWTQTVDQYFLVPFQCILGEYFQPIQSCLSHLSMHFPGDNIYSQNENLGYFFAIWPISVPLKISIGGYFEPYAHTDTAEVALFVSFIEVKMLTDVAPLHSSAFFEGQVKNIGVWSTWMTNFGSGFCSLTLGWIHCIKSYAPADDST